MMKMPLRISLAACLAEYNAMTLFVVFGCGSAMGIPAAAGLPAWVLMVSLTFGLTITALAYTHGHHSGGQINCAVTFGLVLVGQCKIAQGVANVISQLLGSITGAMILCIIFPPELDQTGGLGSNSVGQGWNTTGALTAEIMGTYLLMTVVLQTACCDKSASSRAQAALAIGLSVFIAHVLLIPIDGCSINPTRSFGPALVAQVRYDMARSPFADMWIFWVGPLLGAAIAAGHYWMMEKLSPVHTTDVERVNWEAPTRTYTSGTMDEAIKEELK
mmetsp:Transcript_964/g.2726  ORF Transcript_964/g.2726 Transcript_964/m.2726 type:complete len:274 (+) Transcript_964:101-922(+)